MESELRLWGDPFCLEGPSERLRGLLRAASEAGWRCALCLGGARGEASGAGRRIPLTDGCRDFGVFTRLGDGELAPVLRAAATPVAATAPVVVFGDEDDLLRAGLEYPRACALRLGGARAAAQELTEVGELLAEWPRHDPPMALDGAVLAALAALPPADPSAPVVHFGSADPVAGTDLAVAAAARVGCRLRVVLPSRDPELERRLTELGRGAELEFAVGGFEPRRLCDASAILAPVRAVPSAELLVGALASGRPLLISRFAATAPVLARPGLCYPLGGRPGRLGFEPDPGALAAALVAVRDGAAARATAERARRHALEGHRRDLPAPAAAAPADGRRPVLVLEAPLFELSSSALLTIETARALRRRGRVDLRLVATPPLRDDVGALRRRAPELLACLSRQPPPADLWLSAGWPPRPDRPDATRFGVRFDWEYGAMPVELTPLLTDEADLVVVHSRAVHHVVTAAGRSDADVVTIPHGVDGAVFCPEGPALARVEDFKRGRTALLFVGGLIWRKGIDLLLAAMLGGLDPARTCVVLKALGGDGAYSGYHLAELVERVRAHPGAPDLLLLDDELSAPEMAALYRSCDLLVHPYRGEGFGLPVLEARCAGLPVVVTAGGSTEDFCDGEGCRKIPAVRRRIELPGAHVGHPHVFDPALDDVCRALGEALGELPALTAAARADAGAIRSRHGWAAAAATLERLAFEAAAVTSRREDCLSPVVAATPAVAVAPAARAESLKAGAVAGRFS